MSGTDAPGAATPAPHWIDSHTHLDYEYPFSLDELLANARAAGVIGFITIAAEPGRLAGLRDIAERYPDVWFTTGVHPHEATAFTPEVESLMDSLRAHPKCVALGEIGLDYYYDHSPREQQKVALARQLELALQWNKPIVIHARDAEADLLEYLAPYAERCRGSADGRLPGVIHCFSGTPNFAEQCLKMGFYLSFAGVVTFKKADILRDIVRNIPLDRLLLETDSPYLAPVPYRGKPNQSAYLIETAKLIAQVKNLSLETLSDSTVANSRRIFALSQR